MSQQQDSVGLCRDEEGCDRPAKTRGLCLKHYQRLWRAENSERNAENSRRWYDENLEHRRAYAREYYQRNREKILVRDRAKKEADPEGYLRQKREAAARRKAKDPEHHREVNRRWRAQRLYGLSLEELEEILARGCAICGSHEGRVTGKRGEYDPPKPRLVVDHDHANGKVRDALCHSCNSALGLMGDDPERLEAAAKYIRTHQT